MKFVVQVPQDFDSEALKDLKFSQVDGAVAVESSEYVLIPTVKPNAKLCTLDNYNAIKYEAAYILARNFPLQEAKIENSIPNLLGFQWTRYVE